MRVDVAWKLKPSVFNRSENCQYLAESPSKHDAILRECARKLDKPSRRFYC